MCESSTNLACATVGSRDAFISAEAKWASELVSGASSNVGIVALLLLKAYEHHSLDWTAA